MPEWHLITVLNFHVCWQIQLTLEQKHWLSCAHPFCLSILSRKCHWVISRWFFLSSISFSLRLQEYISYLMSRYCWCRFFVRRCILLVAMNCTSYQLINDNIYHDNAPLKEEPQLLFSQGAVGLEVFDLNRFLFSIQSHHWYTVPKIWSQTYFFFFFFFLLYWRKTNLPCENIIDSSNNNSLWGVNISGTILFRWFMGHLIFLKQSSLFTGSSLIFTNHIIDVNLSLVIKDLNSLFLYSQSWGEKLVCWYGNKPIFQTKPRDCFIFVIVTSFQVFKTLFLLRDQEDLLR